MISDTENKKMVAVCKELDIKDERVLYYVIDKDAEDVFKTNSYLFREKTHKGAKSLSAIYVENVMLLDEKTEKKIEDATDLCFRRVNDNYLFELTEEAAKKLQNANLKEFKKLIKQIINDLNFLIKRSRVFIEEGRKEYLVENYFGVPDEFKNGREDMRNRWLKEVNDSEFDIYYEINILELKRLIGRFIEGNTVMTNIDKEVLRRYCQEELEHIFCTIEPKRNARMLLDDYIGVNIDEEKKDLIWGYRTPYPIRIGFSFFWGMIKNVLSLSYVPIILLILDNEYKIPIYIILSLVYFIALILSDEKQTNKLLNDFKGRINYGTLHYRGLITSLTFIIFSIQMIIMPSRNVCVLIKYLLGGMVSAPFVILLFNVVMSMLCWGVTVYSTTRFYQKRWKKVKSIIGCLIKTTIYVMGVLSLASIFDIRKYWISDVEKLSWDFWVLYLIFMTTAIQIFIIWREEYRKKDR